MMKAMPFYFQSDAMVPKATGSGSTSLRMIAKYYGKSYTVQDLGDENRNVRKTLKML
jgi:hypothetical protein